MADFPFPSTMEEPEYKFMGGGSFPIGAGISQQIVTFQVLANQQPPTLDATGIVPSGTHRGRSSEADAQETALQMFYSLGEFLTVREMAAIVDKMAAHVATHRESSAQFTYQGYQNQPANQGWANVPIGVEEKYYP